MENPIRVPSSSPFSYTIDLTRVAFAVVFGLAALGYAHILAVKPVTPSNPSVPALVAPACDGKCQPAKASTKPFNVVCPYCRNSLSVQPSASGSTTGQVVGAVAPAK